MQNPRAIEFKVKVMMFRNFKYFPPIANKQLTINNTIPIIKGAH